MILMQTEWWLLAKYTFVLVALFIAIKLLGRLLPKFIKRNVKRQRFLVLYKRFKFVFIIVASLLLLLTFVRVNYVVHGGFLVFLTVILFPFIRSLLHGAALQLNGMLHVGMRLQTGSHVGEIKKFTPQGLWLLSVQGNRFVNYLDLHKKGFTTLSNEDSKSRTNVLIESDLKNEQIIDLLFETPFIDHAAMPELKGFKESASRALYFTLQDGVNQEALFAFLNQHQIEIVSKY